MVIENKRIPFFGIRDFQGQEDIIIANSIVGIIDLDGKFDLNAGFKVINCVIENLHIHSCWFNRGFTLANAVVLNYVDYQMGGHNFSPITITGNIFNEFVNFFDCHFNDVVEVKSNIFAKGTNLLGNEGEGYKNIFDKGVIASNNVGILDMSGVG